MLLTNFNKIDISSKNQKFEDLDKTSLRDNVRDLYDELIRRPIYKVVYKNFFKKQNYKIDYTIPAKGLSTLKRFKILNDFKKIQGLSILNIGCGNAFTYHHLFKFKPKSIYGKTKVEAEKLIVLNCKKLNINYAILRYFNVCGASPSGKIGLMSNTDSLFKNISTALIKKKPIIKIYGNDYRTPDGTTIRDYIHVSDLADVHYKILKKISATKKSIIINCGYNKGVSVNEVVNEFKKQSNKKIKILYKKRRLGDLAMVIANNKKLKKTIKWKPKYSKLSSIVKSCIKWEKTINS